MIFQCHGHHILRLVNHTPFIQFNNKAGIAIKLICSIELINTLVITRGRGGLSKHNKWDTRRISCLILMYHEENEVGRFYIFHLCFYINMNFRVIVYWFYIKNHRLLFLPSLKILKCLSLIHKFFCVTRVHSCWDLSMFRFWRIRWGWLKIEEKQIKKLRVVVNENLSS